jgi:2-C-methyl-D-erythritol 4-phosphate cytidylyltransferase / 2-C-methyl-D-erythritol 2,4-cyclodiphosphate synthase
LLGNNRGKVKPLSTLRLKGLKPNIITGKQTAVVGWMFLMHTALILVAAGRGTRAGGELPKQYQEIDGVALARRALQPFLAVPEIGQVIVVISIEDRALAEAAFFDVLDRVAFVAGGSTRQSSVMNGLFALTNSDRVLVHDAARPFVKPTEIAALLALPIEASATLAAPIADSIRRIDGATSEPVSRNGLYAVQTPQMFPFELFVAAHGAAQTQNRNDFTDDCSLMQWHGHEISIVAGSKDNFKITLPEDFLRAETMFNPLPDVRVGQGYDIHSHGPGDHVTLCGVKIPHSRGLDGHSDADVGLHALTDALLATIGAGDIGTHFPPSDPQWRGAASRIFLEHAAKLVRAAGGTITLADVTLICEEPKIGPHRTAMTAIMSESLQIEPFRVSVKATTNERIGAIGRKEGICALASATVVFAPKGTG